MNMIKKYWPYLLIAFLVIIQFFQIDKTPPPSDANLDFFKLENPPAEVASLIKGACYDCHSNETIFPGYTSFQPLGWWVRSHVRGGRMNVNLSEWGNYDPDKQRHILEEMAEVTGNKRMPLKSYGWMHEKGKLSDNDRAAMVSWFRAAKK